MYTLTNDAPEKGILSYMPSSLRKYMYKINLDEAYEIHMRLGKPFMIYYSDGCYFVNSAGVLTSSPKGAVKITRTHIEEALELASHSSLYAKKDSIAEGFITIEGGHRIGICGSGVFKNGRLDFLKDISSLNYRLACEYIGAADIPSQSAINGGEVMNTLFISPPGAGKTTMLRDMARILSENGFHVAIADERSEIAALHGGVSPFRFGNFTDILDGVKKSEAMLMLLRSMSPEVIITDEIGTKEDIEAIKTVINCGVKIIAAIHGSSLAQIRRRSELAECLEFFDVFCTLSRRCGAGTIEEVTEKCSELSAV
ncbi:MAG: stage III sporulation protein AA [Clostridia bacterium]|nr:stage III sporulation protein AA [Clostridia bacterium]